MAGEHHRAAERVGGARGRPARQRAYLGTSLYEECVEGAVVGTGSENIACAQ